MLKDGEAQDVFDSIQKLTCISKCITMHTHKCIHICVFALEEE